MKPELHHLLLVNQWPGQRFAISDRAHAVHIIIYVAQPILVTIKKTNLAEYDLGARNAQF